VLYHLDRTGAEGSSFDKIISLSPKFESESAPPNMHIGDVPEERTYGQWWDSTEARAIVSLDEIRRVGRAAYLAAGASPDDADFLLDVNLDKAIQGDHARGLGKLPEIIAAVRAGNLDLNPHIDVVRERPASALIDGGPKASGRVLCRFGMNLAIDKARQCGVGFVAARASGEILTPYVNQAVAAGMVGMALVQSVPTVAPLGGWKPMLGNAPMAIGVPARGHDPVILDMSFTQSSSSGVLLAAEQRQQVPDGVLLDEHGNPSTDAADYPDPVLSARLGGIHARGSLVPLGGSHKGYAMIFALGLLTSLLADASPPWELYYHLDKRGTYGTLLIAIDPGAFRADGLPGTMEAVDDFIDTLKRSPRKAGVDEILYPGERSQALKGARRAAGAIAVPRSHFEGLVQLATEAGVPPPRLAAPPDT
jgi:L-2-hydroxycarboxylate dehydrogenase (NAD+)